MKTVLFIDKSEEELWSNFQKYDYLLDEFRTSGEFDVCFWNRKGTSVDTTVPDLSAVLGSEERWQAVAVTDLRQDMDSLRDDVHYDNPFDFPERYDVKPGAGFEESQQPLVRLTQMLGGLPEKVTVNWERQEGAGPNLNEFDMVYGHDPEVYDLIERYRLGTSRPSRIICVSPRDVDLAFDAARRQELELAESERQRKRNELIFAREQAIYIDDADVEASGFDDLEAQLRDMELEESATRLGFWERNDYPSCTRFVVVDRRAPSIETPEGQRLAQVERIVRSPFEPEPAEPRSFWFDFWMCVLTLMVSTVMPEDLRAYDVYRMGIRIDEDVLGGSFGYRRAQWVAACNQIDERLRHDEGKLKASEFHQAILPDTQVTIPVVFDLVDTENLLTDPSEVRLLKDHPERDLSVWGRQRARVLEEFRELLRAPRRALRNAADKFRDDKPIPYEDLEYCVLNETEKDNLRDSVRSREIALAQGAGSGAFQYEASQVDFNRADADVRGQITKRVTRRQAATVLVVSAITLFLGFAPLLLGLVDGNGITTEELMRELPYDLLLTIAFIGVMVAATVIILLGMRNKLRRGYVAFNNLMGNIVSNLNDQASVLETRISGYAMFRKEWAVLERQDHLSDPTRTSEWLGRCKALLRTRIGDIDEVLRNCKVDVNEDEFDFVFDTNWNQLDAQLHDEAFYNIRDVNLKLGGYEGFDSGSFADVPYEFISGLALEPMKAS